MRGGPVLRAIRIKFARPLHRWCSEGAFCDNEKNDVAPPDGLHAAARRASSSYPTSRPPPAALLARPHLASSEPYRQADAIFRLLVRAHHCETHLCNSRSINILPPATENVTRIATNKRFANIQQTITTTTVLRYLLSCWFKRNPHTSLLYSVRNAMARKADNISQNTTLAVGRTVGPPGRGTIIIDPPA